MKTTGLRNYEERNEQKHGCKSSTAYKCVLFIVFSDQRVFEDLLDECSFFAHFPEVSVIKQAIVTKYLSRYMQNITAVLA